MKSLLSALTVFLAAGLAAPAVAEPGSCGKGKIWDADQQKCVPKPRGTGSNAG